MGLDVDPAFFQAPEQRPEPSIDEAGGIPLIDLSPLSYTSIPGADAAAAAPEALAALLQQVGAACRDWGFFQVVNHGVPAELLERVQAAARGFFALRADEKRRVSRDDASPLGYYDTEYTKNVRDWKEVFDFLVVDGLAVPGPGEPTVLRNQWPAHPPALREACQEYAAGVEKLAFTLLELIALTLGLPGGRLRGYFDEQSSFVRLNHYPPCPVAHLALGVGCHKDAGALTVLSQDDVGGLDVKRKSDGLWVRVRPIANSYIINVGDVVQVWSNDRYESPEHRVSVNSEKERFSIPFFFNPGFSATVKPLDELVDERHGHPPKYEEFNWGEFFRARADSNFKKLARENLQIHHFKKQHEE